MKPDHASDYDPTASAVLHAELERVLQCFGAAREHLTVIGGLVPGLLVPDPPGDPHAGSADVDLCLTVALASGATAAYDDAARRLRRHGFAPSVAPRKEFRWRGRAGVVVDFLYPAAAGEPPLQTIRTGLEWEPSVASLGLEFAALAVGHGPLVDATRTKVPFSPVLDGRVVPGAAVHVTGPGGFAALKADALASASRNQPKDAYDLVWLLDALDPDDAAAATVAATAAHPDVAADLSGVLDRLDDLFAPGGHGSVGYARFVARPDVAPSAPDERFATETVATFVAGVRDRLGY